jgi:hypothetical protein
MENKVGDDLLLVSYKSIYINLYSLFILDIKTGFVTYKHDSFCLWENKIMSFFNTNSEDYISLCAEGMFTMTLGQKKQSKLITDTTTQDLNRCHALNSCNYLRLEKNNHILFDCSSKGDKIIEI